MNFDSNHSTTDRAVEFKPTNCDIALSGSAATALELPVWSSYDEG